MDTELCDVCDAEALYMCGECMQSVYCGSECQQLDYAEHQEHCIHIDHMIPEHIEHTLNALAEYHDTELDYMNTEEQRQFLGHLLMPGYEDIGNLLKKGKGKLGKSSTSRRKRKMRKARRKIRKKVKKAIGGVGRGVKKVVTGTARGVSTGMSKGHQAASTIIRGRGNRQ
jgi:MYND finger